MFSKELLKNATFNWKDLHGKNLKIHVSEEDGYVCVMGLDRDKIYILYCNKINCPSDTLREPKLKPMQHYGRKN